MIRNLFIALLFVLGLQTQTIQAKSNKKEVVEISTEFGKIYFVFYDRAEKHKVNFIKLADKKFFDGTTFHRCIKNFVIQGGDPNSKDNDPNNDGEGGPEYTGEAGTYKAPNDKSYTIDAEIFPEYTHKYGVVAAAREGDQINPQKRSSGSQFYITIRKSGITHLDKNYTIFGEVIQGMEIAETIADQAKDDKDRPLKNITMKVKVLKMKPKQIEKKFGFVFPTAQ